MRNEPIEESSRLITPREAASRLAVSEKTLANWRCTGGGPRFIKISHGNGAAGAIRYNVRELERWIAERTIGSTSDVLAGADE